MIVSEKNVSDALSYLADDPHPVAEARHRLTVAETNAKTIYSRLILASSCSTVATKEAEAMQDVDYLQAKSEEASALLDLERHKARVKAADMLISVWQSEGANIRAAERVR